MVKNIRFVLKLFFCCVKSVQISLMNTYLERNIQKEMGKLRE
jgi:hypothetical protein